MPIRASRVILVNGALAKNRSVLEYCEGDLIGFLKNSSIATLLERFSQYVILTNVIASATSTG